MGFKIWCRKLDLNQQPTDYKSVALPIVLFRQIVGAYYKELFLAVNSFLHFLQCLSSLVKQGQESVHTARQSKEITA